MPTLTDIKAARTQLEKWRETLEAPFAAAKDRGDEAEMRRLTLLASDIDAVLDELAFLSLGQIAANLEELKAKIQGDDAAAQAAGQLFPNATVSQIKQRLDEIFAESSEEILPDSAPPAAPAETTPAPPVTASPPDLSASDGRLILTAAHLIGLWKRSQFPIDSRGILVFGLRGSRPVDFSGTDFASSQEFALKSVNYRTMNCTLGQWRPATGGIALFPGSTVPFGATVTDAIAKGGAGVNQIGLGRYTNYFAGWHKRSEGSNGHWALIQDCPITLQRTADDADFDNLDRWDVGRKAGDNIHCAFHMGEDSRIPDVQFSSAGCQTIAGTVRKGVRDSERGPWRRFIAPFLPVLGAQKSTEYVLFLAEEAQQIIRTHYEGKTILLRMGSAGPWVEKLQAALASRGASVKVDGDFGPSTFQAVIDFQAKAFGESQDDGIVGPTTAEELGFSLPVFDFDDAVAGGAGIRERTEGPAIPRAPVAALAAAVPVDEPRISWGGTVTRLHGAAFKTRCLRIAQMIGCDPNHLLAIMAFETGGSFDPAQPNHAGSGAVGLIQFMPDTARGLGTTTEQLAAMSALEQLDFVERYFKSVVGSRKLATLSDAYMAVLLPAAIGKLESHALFAAPSKAYAQNRGLDINNNGSITKAEATARVNDRLVEGMRATNVG